MPKIVVASVFDNVSGRPLVTGVLNPKGDVKLYDLYVPGSGATLERIEKNYELIKSMFVAASDRGVDIMVDDFKGHLAGFDLPVTLDRWSAHELHLGRSVVSGRDAIRESVLTALQDGSLVKPAAYRNLMANAAVVYNDMEKYGVINGGIKVKTRWLQSTSTGRSKNVGFNLQGVARSDRPEISNPRGSLDDTFVYIDWTGADFRLAAEMAGDSTLVEVFRDRDPYSWLAEDLGVDRKKAKLEVLTSINQMRPLADVFDKLPRIRKWIKSCDRALDSEDGYLETLLGRRYYARGKTKLQVFNATMQGSVAHAMHAAVRRVWEEVGGRLMAEIHDSIVMTSRPGDAVSDTIDRVAPIMLRPFDELYSDGECSCNPDFQFKVSVGDVSDGWHGWKSIQVHRASGVSRISEVKHNEVAEAVSTEAG